MNPENNQPEPQVPAAPPVETPVAPVAPSTPPDKKTPIQMLTSILSGLKKKPTEGVSTSTEKKKFAIPKKALIIAGIVVFLLILLMVVMSMMSRNGGGILPTSTPTPTPSPTPVVEVPSQYADDEDVAEIQKQMEDLDKQLNEASFRDDTLRVPSLDWNVKFED